MIGKAYNEYKNPAEIALEIREEWVKQDMVNNPAHYQSEKGIECIDAIQAQLTFEEYRGYLKGNIIKYLWRERAKGGVESCKKAAWYLNRLIGLNES